MGKFKTKTTDYSRLREIWYKKLKKSGFKDIEQDEDNLKVWTIGFFKKQPKEVWEAKRAYYHMADSFLHDYKFETELEKIIWEYHANGLGCRAIATTLKKVKIVKRTNRTAVWEIIKRLRTIMKKMYMQDEREA